MDIRELMQKKGSLCDQQQAIVDAALKANRAMTDDEQKQFDQLQKDIDALSATIARAEQVAARQEDLGKPAGALQRIIPGDPAPQVLDDSGFKSLGEFIDAVRFGDPKGRLQSLRPNPGQGNGIKIPEKFAQRLMPFRNEWSTGAGSGGAAIPRQFDPNVLRMPSDASIVRPRAQVIEAGDPPDAKITIPAFKQGSAGALGGVAVQWIGEGVEKPETNGALEEISLQPQEVAAHTIVTDKLLRNWGAASSFIENLLRNAMLAAEDIAFLTGTGVGKPTGVVGAAGGMAVKRAVANKISYTDIVNMLAVLFAESQETAVWIANQSILPQLVTIQDGGGRYIFIAGDAAKGIPSTLAGIPIRFTGRTKALGNKGDLCLVDFGYYLIKDGSGPYVAASEHVLFRQNKTVIKAFWNVDGKPWVPEPLTLDDGVTKVSPYVVLDVPQA